MKSITVDAEVYLDEILPEISTEALIEELQQRNAPHGFSSSDYGALRQAIADGRKADALALFDRLFLPRFRSEADCRKQYAMALETRRQ